MRAEWRRVFNLAGVSLAHLINHVYVQIHLAILPVLMLEFDFSLTLAGLIVSVTVLCQALATVPGGLLADRLGYMKMISIALALTIMGALLMYNTYSIYIMVFALSIVTVSSALYHPAGYSFVSELFSKEHRGKSLGIQGGAGTFGIAIGPITAGLLLPLYGWRISYLTWVVPVALVIPVIWVFRVEREAGQVKPSREREISSSEVSGVLTATFIMFLAVVASRAMGMQMASTFLSTFLVRERGVSAAVGSIIFGSMSLMGSLAAVIGGFMTDKLGEVRWLSASLLGSSVTLIFVAYIQPLTIVVVAILLYGFFLFSAMGATTSLVARFTPMNLRGTGYALFFLPTYVAGAIAPLLAGSLAETLGVQHVFPLSAAMFLVSLSLLQRLSPYTRRAY